LAYLNKAGKALRVRGVVHHANGHEALEQQVGAAVVRGGGEGEAES